MHCNFPARLDLSLLKFPFGVQYLLFFGTIVKAMLYSGSEIRCVRIFQSLSDSILLSLLHEQMRTKTDIVVFGVFDCAISLAELKCKYF